MSKAIIYVSQNGEKVAEKLRTIFPGSEVLKYDKKLIPELWNRCSVLIFVCATGIAVRSIAGLLKDKKQDPAVIVIDEKGKNVIPLLGGHSAEANNLCLTISGFLKANPVITTSSDLKGLPALDLWIKKTGLIVKNPEILKKLMAEFNKSGKLKSYIESSVNLPLPKELVIVSDVSEADVVITNRVLRNLKQKEQLILIPRNLCIGIGFHDWISAEELKKAVNEVLEDGGYLKEAVLKIATLDKKALHPALKTLAESYGAEIIGFSSEELNQVKSKSPAGASMKALGVASVSEQSALLSALSTFNEAYLCSPKRTFKDITIAIAEGIYKVKGKLYIVGTGPGDLENLTVKAISVLRSSDFIVGYKTYIKLIKPLIEDKKFLTYGMTQEVERAKIAIKKALEGNVVSLISGGDPGIYGMAGLVLEILARNNLDLEIEIIPGISALNACASLTGAPLMNDFLTISLSDRLTPWDVIEKRLRLAGEGDLVVVIYNPKSKSRKTQLSKAKRILLSYKNPKTPVAIVKGAFRKEQEVILTTLEKMDSYPVDMQTTIIIGNSKSFVFKNWLITQRGYQEKYEEELQISSNSLG